MIIQTIHDLERFDDVVALQMAVWGPAEICPRNQLKAIDTSGGAVHGAFEDGRLLGFSLAWTGWDDEGAYLYSHMLAVRPEARRRHLGRRIKEAQRDWALERGFKKMAWTFDPFRYANARLNLNALGGRAVAFIPDCYGSMTDRLNRGQPSDRFLVRWDLEGAPPAPPEGPGTIRVPIPRDLESLWAEDPGAVLAWRERFGGEVSELFSEGYTATSVDDGEGAYMFSKEARD